LDPDYTQFTVEVPILDFLQKSKQIDKLHEAWFVFFLSQYRVKYCKRNK